FSIPKSLSCSPRQAPVSPAAPRPHARLAAPPLSTLIQTASSYMKAGLAPSTLKTYTHAWLTFVKFCASQHIPHVPVLTSVVLAFITFCYVHRRLKPPYIRSLLAGINFFAKCLQTDFAPSLLSNHSIKLLLRGISKSYLPRPDPRKPITAPILKSLILTVRSSPYSPYVKSLLSSVYLLAFFGFLRLGEFTTPSNAFIPSRDLTISDLKFFPDHYSLYLKHSKGKGPVSVIIARLDCQFCPFLAMFEYALNRHKIYPRSAPLFLTPEGLPMSSSWFLKFLRETLISCNLAPSQYSGHSFRIGAATSAASLGLPSASLQRLGRWSSSAYASYIRPE
uniref:Core-binding (CB) domain-containing protein n=1 Tax=Poecilia formosa TaxID=48698 RepID=A0A096M1W8_POEFO